MFTSLLGGALKGEYKMREKELIETIEIKRNVLIQYGLYFGLSSPVVIKQSQELDRLLNCLDQMKMNERMPSTNKQ